MRVPDLREWEALVGLCEWCACVAAVAHAIGGIDCHALLEEVRDRRVVTLGGSVPDVSTIRLQGRGSAAVPRAARLQDHPHDHSREVVPLLASRRRPAVVTLRAFLNCWNVP